MTENIAHSGVWILAIIFIVIASWIFYRYFAPKTWHEWAGAGVVHWPTVFSVALFPIIVTAYVALAYREEKRMLREFANVYRGSAEDAKKEDHTR